MRVYRTSDGLNAAWRKSRDGLNEGFFVTPVGSNLKVTPVGSNLKDDAKWIGTVDELGYFLIKNPDWKVYFGDNQQISDVVIDGQIELSKLR